MEASLTGYLAAAALVLGVFAVTFVTVCAVTLGYRVLHRRRPVPAAELSPGADLEARLERLLQEARRVGGPLAVAAVQLPADPEAAAGVLARAVRAGDVAGVRAGAWVAAAAMNREAATAWAGRLAGCVEGASAGVSVFPYDAAETSAILVEKAVQRVREPVVCLVHGTAPSGGPPGGWKDVVMPQEFEQALGRYWAAHQEDPRGISVVRVDIDHYKLYGEQYGPRAGADVVQQLGSLLRRNVRHTDLVAHARDDEFVLAMPALPDQARVAAMRILGVVRKSIFPFSGQALKITVSLGIASAPSHGHSVAELERLSEAALRTAKARGRNTVIIYDSSLAASGPLRSDSL